MEFNALSGKKTSKKPKKDLPVNVAMRLDRIEINTDKPSLFHGYLVGSNEPVVVRMMTVDEAVGVNMRKGEEAEATKARLTKQYVGTGEAHRPRPAEINNESHKTHCATGGLLMFTKCLKGEDGTYRAHWVETMEAKPGAGCDNVVANIRIDDVRDANGEIKGTNVVADVINPERATVLNSENAMGTLLSTFADRNGQEKRKPFLFARLIEPATGKVVLTARASAHYNENERTDQDTGATFKVFEAGTAEESVTALFNPEKTGNEAMIVRAAIFGLGTEPGYPQYKDVSPQALEELKTITDAVRSGALQVEVIPGERISAGPAARAGIAKAVKTNANHPLNVLYSQRNDNGFVTQRRFTPTFLTTKLGADGHRFFTKAVAADLYPKMETISTLATVNDFKAEAEAAKARAAEANSDEVLVGDDVPFDPTALDGGLDESVDQKLSQSAAALDHDM